MVVLQGGGVGVVWWRKKGMVWWCRGGVEEGKVVMWY